MQVQYKLFKVNELDIINPADDVITRINDWLISTKSRSLRERLITIKQEEYIMIAFEPCPGTTLAKEIAERADQIHQATKKKIDDKKAETNLQKQ